MIERRSPVRTPRHGGALLLPAAAALLLSGCGASPASRADTGGASSGTTAAAAGKGPEATTYTATPAAPADAHPQDGTDGTVVHPAAPLAVLDRPGGKAVATLPARQLGGPTWVPVVETSGDWQRVLLPSRPNGSSGWIDGRTAGLRTARSPYAVRVELGEHRLTLTKEGAKVGSWPVGTGAAKTPTPQGRTFVLAQLAPARESPSPLVLPLGAHSATLDSFGGGPGTVALHGWPDKAVFGKAVSHGCVRVPADALRKLSEVPLGTLVLISG
ncbi:L,D-transpeptidase [Actinomadura parmotrematis]|uniref:L,D-transpeptidase family protein n=1 Tax=Actinomadura parmotrematis TaxID=2864039 RepID=A0ABS7FR56_9ACTN|nr:L,D-transpeptidase [Actinomadura parmotrematis]MBW8482022.1 L,D-transpeptidase family protein [Actinomadura parmotrematis]